MKLNKTYTAAWVLWLASFAVLEFHAVIDPGSGDTLTETIREWLKLYDRHAWVGRTVFAVFLAWLTHHFMRIKKRKE